MSKAVLEKESAIKSVNIVVSSASKPKALNVLAVVSAACDKSILKAVDKSKIPPEALIISLVVKPNLASSNCNPATSSAVNIDDLPKFLADFSSNPISLALAPDTAPTSAIACSKSLIVSIPDFKTCIRPPTAKAPAKAPPTLLKAVVTP